MPDLQPLNIKQWINQNREKLKPPVCNQVIVANEQFIVMAVGGPNARSDFHVNPTDEIFFQVEGDMRLHLIENTELKTITIREGELFLLPPHIPHSPERTADTAGLVIEKKRQARQQDGFQWYCEHCRHKLHEEFLHIHDIVKQLPPVFERFFAKENYNTCPQCQSVSNLR